ncbi:MAG: hypothetical protein LBN22_03675 [Clostridiales Family XIII bacterium]|nr:hypothetical protein [Clostridiales Family XIII bacterium]
MKNKEILLKSSTTVSIAETLRSGINKMLPDTKVNRFTARCHKSMTSGLAINQFKKNVLSSAEISCIITLCALTVTATSFVAYNIIDLHTSIAAPVETPSVAVTAMQKPFYEPDVQILGANGEEAAFQNPDELHIQINDNIGYVIQCSIKEQLGSDVYHTTGDILSASTLTALPAGEYEAIWVVSTEDQRAAAVRWKFIVDENI